MIFPINNTADRRAVISYIEALPENRQFTAEIKPKRKRRTIDQNSLMWLFLACISQETGHTANDLHHYFKKEYLQPEFRTVFGKTVELEQSTTKLDTAQFTAYLDRIKSFASSELGISLPNPEDLYFEQFCEYYKNFI